MKVKVIAMLLVATVGLLTSCSKNDDTKDEVQALWDSLKAEYKEKAKALNESASKKKNRKKSRGRASSRIEDEEREEDEDVYDEEDLSLDD